MTQESTFDEQRVLAELEQLQLAIRATRAQRERVQAEFDAQLRAFEPPTLSHTPPPAKPGAFVVPSIPANGTAQVAAEITRDRHRASSGERARAERARGADE